MLFVPTPDGYPHVRVSVPLSGATYTIVWDWNERDGAWYFGMDDPSGEALVSGVRVVLGIDLLRWAPAGDRRPTYGIAIIDPSEKGRHPDLDAFGRDVFAVYLEPDEEDEA